MAVPQSSDLSLETGLQGVELRELVASDLDAYYDLVDRNRSHLNQRGDYPFEADATRDDIATYFASPWDNNIRFGVWISDGLVGRVDLVPINPPHWVIGYEAATGHGIATAACRAAIRYASSLGATEIYAGITNGNEPSIRLVQRLEFERIQDLDSRSRWLPPLIDNPPPPVMA